VLSMTQGEGGQPLTGTTGAAVRRPVTRPPKAGRPWTSEEDELALSALPAKEVARLTGRTAGAVWDRRGVLRRERREKL